MDIVFPSSISLSIRFIFIDIILLFIHHQPLYQDTMLNSDVLTHPRCNQTYMHDLYTRKQRFPTFFLSDAAEGVKRKRRGRDAMGYHLISSPNTSRALCLTGGLFHPHTCDVSIIILSSGHLSVSPRVCIQTNTALCEQGCHQRGW